VRAVAAEAGVSHSVLHRHFPTKEELFSAALVAPFLRFFEDLATVWDDDPERTWTDAELTHELVTHMYTNLSEYRLNLADLLMVRESDRDLLREVRQGLDGVRIKLQGLEKRGARARGSGPPRHLAAHGNRMIAALVAGLVVLRPFLSNGENSEDDGLIANATDALLNGVWTD
jgi:AcrR family transcriptional regulator